MSGAVVALPRRAREVGLTAGRLELATLVALYLVAVSLQDWYWPRFGVPGVSGLPFNDIRFWTTAWDCVRDGVEVVPTNPCDPQMRYLDHPRIWLAPAVLGLGEESTFALGVAIVAAFFLSVIAVIGDISLGDGLLYAAMLCSPTVMLGVERANTDLVVFVLLTIGLVLLRRDGVVASIAAHACFLLTAFLKLYPVLAWGALVRRPLRTAAFGIGALLLAFAAYAYATRDHLRAIRENFPRELRFSYGASVLGEGSGVQILEGTRGQLLLVGAACVAGGLIAAFLRRRRWPDRAEAARGGELEAFWAGAGIYLGSFAFTYNFNYRLSFLLLTVPQLLRWSRGTRPEMPYARFALTLILFSLWFGTSLAFYPFGLGERWERLVLDFPYDEVANLVLFAYLLAALVVTLPGRLSVSPGRRSAHT